MSATLSGTVTIENAVGRSNLVFTITVTDSKNNQSSTTTDSRGSYSFESLATGECNIVVEVTDSTDYEPALVELELIVGSNTLNGVLEPDPPVF